MKHIAIFASGRGTNAQAIIEYFSHHPSVKVNLVLTNNPAAGVLATAHEHKIISAIVNLNTLQNELTMTRLLNALQIDFIALAGFLQKVPGFLLARYSHQIINIHPALLPRHGGKGMYGIRVHEAVIAAGDTETGISIHYVNEHYDEGKLIVQKKIAVQKEDTPLTLSTRVLALEHEWYPKTIEQLLA